MNAIIPKSLIGLLIVFALFSVSFAAAEVIISNQDQLTIDVNYGSLRDNDNEYIISNHNFDVTNTGAITETVTISLTEIASGYNQMQLDGSTSPLTFTLDAGASRAIKLSGEAPVNKDAGTQSNIAKLKITTTSGQDQSFSLNTKVKNMLDIDRIYVYLNDAEEDTLSSNDDKISGLNPGDVVELRFSLENLFDDNYDDGSIDGTINVQIDDSDFGDDIDEEVDFDIPAGERLTEEDNIVINFTVPSTAEEGDYTLDLNIESKDDSKANHDLSWTINLEVERKENDLRIDQLTFTPTEVSCVRQVTVNVDVTNYGNRAQSRGVLTLDNPELGLNQKFDFSIKEGTSKNNKVSHQFTFNVDPKILSGSFPLTARVFYNLDDLGDQEYVDLVVKGCSTASAASSTVKTNTTPAITTGTSQASSTSTTPTSTVKGDDKVSSATIVKTVEKSYTTDDYIVAVMIGGIVLILILIVLFILILVKGKRMDSRVIITKTKAR
ncbi:MAG: hypothetical protein WCV90_05420 [Candidatus Woesearchaeota archaeon]